MEDRKPLDRQIAYYWALAGEYDEWCLRKAAVRSRFGAEGTLDARFRRVGRRAAADGAHGDVLEFACGTGLWMRHLAGICRHVVALDSSLEVIEINRGRVGRDNVEFRLADLFVWAPDR